MQEIEIKFLDIDVNDVTKKLFALGAEKMGEYHYRRIVFDYSDFRLDTQGAWLRLRDEGEKITLTYKQRLGKNLNSIAGDDEGMLESETIVESFDRTRDILLKIGLIEKMYQENKRTRYILDGVEFDIDSWPLINPYLEIEGLSWDKVYEAAEKLGFNKKAGKIFSTNEIYRQKGLDDRNYTKLTFAEQIEREENKFKSEY
jgi:adenylate cyclase class 2